jgi:acyl carrier protein
VTGGPGHEAVVRRLTSLLEEIAGDSLEQPITYSGPGSVRRLGLTSVQLLQLLIAVENEFNMVWNDDLDESVISSIDEMARCILSVTAVSGS